MKRFYTLLVLTIALMLHVQAQNAFYVYRNDGYYNAFFNEEVDSMVYSNVGDKKSEHHEATISCEIHTKDSCFIIPLESIDSVAFNKSLDVCYKIDPNEIGDWDDGYVYFSSRHKDIPLSCFIKELPNSSWIYLKNGCGDSINKDFIFVFDDNKNLIEFCNNDVLYYVDNDVIIGVDSLGNIVKQVTLPYSCFSRTIKKASNMNILDCLSLIGDVLSVVDAADNKEWGNMLTGIAETGIDLIPLIGEFYTLIKIINYFGYIGRQYKLYKKCYPYITNVTREVDGLKTVTVKIMNASTLPYEIIVNNTNNYPIITKEKKTIEQYCCGISSKEGSPYVSCNNYSERPSFEIIDKSTEEIVFSLSEMEEIGEVYYIVPYIIYDNHTFLEGEIRYGPVYKYVNNDIEVDFHQNYCTYIGKENVKLDFKLNAEIMSLNNVQVWFVPIKDNNSNTLYTAYPSEMLDRIDLKDIIVLNRELFDEEGKTAITLCPYYDYGFDLQRMNCEEKSYELNWRIKVETNDAVIRNEDIILSSLSVGFDMRNYPNDCKIGFLYGTDNNLSMYNSSVVLSEGKQDGYNSIVIPNSEKGKYYYKAFVEIEGVYYWGETKSFSTLPVQIVDVVTTSAIYRPIDQPGYVEYDGTAYEFDYGVTTTVQLKDDEDVEKWGYCYDGPDRPKKTRINLMGASHTVEDSRFHYYRNGNPHLEFSGCHTANLFPFIKYTDETDYQYGIPVDYPLIYPAPDKCTITLNENTAPNLVTEENVFNSDIGVQYDYCTTITFGYDAVGAYWFKVKGEEKGDGWKDWGNHLMVGTAPTDDGMAKAADGGNKLTVNYYYNEKKLSGVYYLRLIGIGKEEAGTSYKDKTLCSTLYIELLHDGKKFTGCKIADEQPVTATARSIKGINDISEPYCQKINIYSNSNH